jgi:hypothetical protein
MKLLDDYMNLQKQVFDYFGYAEDWVVIPIDSSREMYWCLDGEGPGNVHFAKTEKELEEQTGDYYVNAIYTQRFLPKWVYRGPDYTMICVDTQTDGNKFLSIFENAKERPALSELLAEF